MRVETRGERAHPLLWRDLWGFHLRARGLFDALSVWARRVAPDFGSIVQLPKNSRNEMPPLAGRRLAPIRHVPSCSLLLRVHQAQSRVSDAISAGARIPDPSQVGKFLGMINRRGDGGDRALAALLGGAGPRMFQCRSPRSIEPEQERSNPGGPGGDALLLEKPVRAWELTDLNSGDLSL